MKAKHIAPALIAILASACSSSSGISQRHPSSDGRSSSDWQSPSAWRPSIDRQFIRSSLGKKFEFIRPSGPGKEPGEPNCVAAALRAGGYLPAFALNGTDSFYDFALPRCFEKLPEGSIARAGDLGVVYKHSLPTLAHAVLFLGPDEIFEKPSPLNEDLFRLNSWVEVKKNNSQKTIRFEIWRYRPGQECPLGRIRASFHARPELVGIAREVERRIYSGDWSAQKGLKARLELLREEANRETEEWARGLPGGFQIERDLFELQEFLFVKDLINVLLLTPAAG